ncbi:hypothetical protein HK405_003659 [Cladochytrium tenue]|nr:hypothetical protein HK405_003659 [Cladochytrium tenue]
MVATTNAGRLAGGLVQAVATLALALVALAGTPVASSTPPATAAAAATPLAQQYRQQPLLAALATLAADPAVVTAVEDAARGLAPLYGPPPATHERQLAIADTYVVVMRPSASLADLHAHAAARLAPLLSSMSGGTASEDAVGAMLADTFDFAPFGFDVDVAAFPRGYSMRIPPPSTTAAVDVLETVRADPLVEYLERDLRVHARYVLPSSAPPAAAAITLASPLAVIVQPRAPWGLARISRRKPAKNPNKADYVYGAGDGTGVSVYIIDTGIFVGHDEFEGRAVWGKTVPKKEDDEDGNGHGTHVAGIIAGKTFGVAKNATVIAVKVLDAEGSGSNSDVIRGIEYVATQHAARAAAATGGTALSVANLSLGGWRSRSLDAAVNAAAAAGVHFAVAAGNEDEDACDSSPAAAKAAISVMASNDDDERAGWSNWGKCVALGAPGEEIESAWKPGGGKKGRGRTDRTKVLSGTSMASPHVAGAIAALLSRPDQPWAAMPAAKLRSALISLATKDALSHVKKSKKTPNRLLYSDPPATANAQTGGGGYAPVAPHDSHDHLHDYHSHDPPDIARSDSPAPLLAPRPDAASQRPLYFTGQQQPPPNSNSYPMKELPSLRDQDYEAPLPHLPSSAAMFGSDKPILANLTSQRRPSQAGGDLRRGLTRSGGTQRVHRPMLSSSDTLRRRPTAHSDYGPVAAAAAAAAARSSRRPRNPWLPANPWVAFSWMATCCIPGFCLGIAVKGSGPQQAWREKVALCWIVLLLSGVVLFFIVFFNKLICPTSHLVNNNVPLKAYGGVLIRGTMFNAINASAPYNTLFEDVSAAFPGIDVTTQFSQPSDYYTECTSFNNTWSALEYQCEKDDSCIDITIIMQSDLNSMGFYPYNTTSDGTTVEPYAKYTWNQIKARSMVVYKDTVLNFVPYLQQYPNITDSPDAAEILIRSSVAVNDITHLVAKSSTLKDSQEIRCLAQKYYAGTLDILPPECMLTEVVTYLVTALVLAIILTRYVMAVAFSWCIAARLSRKPKPDSLRERDYYEKRPPMPLLRQLESTGEIEAAFAVAGAGRTARSSVLSTGSTGQTRRGGDPRRAHLPTAIGAYDTDLHTVILVTCYSEGETSMRNTLESLVSTDYHDEKKLLFVVCDGVITGKGNEMSTPDIVLSLIQLDDVLGGNPKPYPYVAVASGTKQYNMAKVYCGTYIHKGRAVPTIVVVKCGGPTEANAPKPGNRGKRDSQLILMNFFSRVVLEDRMTPLDYDMFRKIHHITGFTPDYYEILLMVDADTMVHPDSLRAMTNCMYNNPSVMGLCGETTIDNKRTSWVTMIQVFEYYISHHLGKAFESVFGGVTCLPGCFCMYRIKARRGDEWIPIVVNPDIVSEYSTNEVDTLHQKNLLLLGEDRFLTTLMLRKFPRRKQVFVPGALCRTTVPEDFWTLLSQRRRWINSTIHNLMELVLLRDLCGTFCFSMQFVVLMDLIGTAILPISLCLLYYMIYVSAAQTHYTAGDWTSYSNTIMLVGVLFLPAVLVVLVSRKFSLVLWMLLYLLALPVWQFVLPLYSFWNFDDFSWGATRQVAGASGKDDGHGGSGGDEAAAAAAAVAQVPFRRWEEYEASWRRAVLAKRAAANAGTLASSSGIGASMSPATSFLSPNAAAGAAGAAASPASTYHLGAPFVAGLRDRPAPSPAATAEIDYESLEEINLR